MDEVPSERPFAYDELDYPIVISPDMSPDRVNAGALAHGFGGADPETASYLEIGCASGYNPMAIAMAYPRSRSVGFDLSAGAIAEGKKIAEAAELTNVVLEHGDILTYPRDGEKFDYIAAHGVYAWIPEHVRRPMLELIAARLAPGGIAYIGYDSLPTAAVKHAINKMLVRLIQPLTDPTQRIETAISVVQIFARHQREFSRFKTVLDQLVRDMPTFRPGYFYHDWIAEHYAPVSLPDLAKAAAEFGLAFAADGHGHDLHLEDLDSDARTIVNIAGDDLVARNVTLDMLRGGHSYRADLFVSAAAPPKRQEQPWRQLSYSYHGKREEVVEDGAPGVKYEHEGVTAICRRPETIKVLDLLFERAPGELSYEAIRAETGLSEEDIDSVVTGQVTLRLFETHSGPQPFTTAPSERPVASPLARAALAHGTRAPSLRHTAIEITDPAGRLLVVLSDGTRTDAEIAAGIHEVLGQNATAEGVRKGIGELAKLRLFVS